MKVLFASSEAAPFFKSGGLGDVAYALPKELVKQDVDIRVVLPFYQQMPQVYKDQLVDLTHFDIKVGWKTAYCGIKQLILDNVTYYFIDNLDYFNRGRLYGEWDDGERFAFFSLAVCEMMEKVSFIPDIIHVNDWHTAMIPALLVDKYHWIASYRHIRKILTIHNLQFQGIYDMSVLADLFGTNLSLFTDDGAKYYDKVNFLKAGINFSDAVTTVSPTYAQEIKTADFGEGLQDTLNYNAWKLDGVLNGIDYDLNNPENDAHIPHHFTSDDLAGKAKDKAALQERLNLLVKPDTPLISCVSRLTNQKGFQLIASVFHELMQQDVQFVLLGTGDKQFETFFAQMSQQYPDKCRAIIDFDIALAQQLYAASDFFLMPSAFEPCGLSQLMALRYGTLPIVHETGGLKDTVYPYNENTGKGTGFSFYGFSAENLMRCLYQALDVYHNDKDSFAHLRQQAMAQNFSWIEPAKKYKQIYLKLLDEF